MWWPIKFSSKQSICVSLLGRLFATDRAGLTGFAFEVAGLLLRYFSHVSVWPFVNWTIFKATTVRWLAGAFYLWKSLGGCWEFLGGCLTLSHIIIHNKNDKDAHSKSCDFIATDLPGTRWFINIHFVGIHLWSSVDLPPLFFKNVANHSAYFHSAAFYSISRQIGQCWKFGQNSSSVIHTSVILQNCGQPLSVPLFHCILLHFEMNWNMLKIWLEFIFSHVIPLSFFKTGVNHSAYLHSAAFCSISRQIGQCWKFGQNSSLIIHTSIILQNCSQPLSVLSFCCILLHFEANQTMLKIWSEVIFDHSYFHYSSKLGSTTQHTFIPLHFAPFWGKSDNVENLVGIHLRSCHISVILQNCGQPLSVASFCCISLHFEANRTMLKIWSEFIFGHLYLHYSSNLELTTQHTFIPLHFTPFWGKSDNVENLVGIHLWSFVPPLFFKSGANHSVYLCSAAFCSILR